MSFLEKTPDAPVIVKLVPFIQRILLIFEEFRRKQTFTAVTNIHDRNISSCGLCPQKTRTKMSKFSLKSSDIQ